jgi:hypothetical protein
VIVRSWSPFYGRRHTIAIPLLADWIMLMFVAPMTWTETNESWFLDGGAAVCGSFRRTRGALYVGPALLPDLTLLPQLRHRNYWFH